MVYLNDNHTCYIALTFLWEVSHVIQAVCIVLLTPNVVL